MSNLPIENLPEYLKSIKNGQTDVPVVGMGTIEEPKSNKLKWAAALLAACLTITTGGLIYNSNQSNTVFVTASNEAEAQEIARHVVDGGGQILAINETENAAYEVKIFTRKNKGALLEWLKKFKK